MFEMVYVEFYVELTSESGLDLGMESVVLLSDLVAHLLFQERLVESSLERMVVFGNLVPLD